MIQPASLPAAAKLLLAIDGPPANGDGSAIDAQFSALLAASSGAAPDVVAEEAGAAPHPEMPFNADLRPANSKHSGKLPGKILPDSPALASFTSLMRTLRGTGQKEVDPNAAQADEAAPLASEPADQPSPLESAPVPTLAVAVPVAIELAVITVMPTDDSAPALPQPAAVIAQPATIAATKSSLQELAVAAPVPTGSDGLVKPGRTAQVRPGTNIQATPDGATSTSPEIAPETTPLVIQSGFATRMVFVPRIHPRIADLAKLQNMAPELARSGEVPPQTAPLQVCQSPEEHAAQLIAARLPDSTEIIARTAASARPRSTAIGDPENPLETPRAVLASLQAAPLLSPELTAAPASSPAIGASQAPAQPKTPDFAALIDRLVEARQAAQSTLAAQTVNAAVNHAEFGQLSLQFRHDADGLSVVMASADPDLAPDLARAMQVAAPTGGQFGGQFGGTGDGSAPSPRQDLTGQQSAGTSQTQSHGQQRGGQSPQRAPDRANDPANPSSRARAPSDHGTRSGIFA